MCICMNDVCVMDDVHLMIYWDDVRFDCESARLSSSLRFSLSLMCPFDDDVCLVMCVHL